MNGLHTRSTLHHHNTRPSTEGETRPIDRIIALVCALLLIGIFAEQVLGGWL